MNDDCKHMMKNGVCGIVGYCKYQKYHKGDYELGDAPYNTCKLLKDIYNKYMNSDNCHLKKGIFCEYNHSRSIQCCDNYHTIDCWFAQHHHGDE